MAKKEKSHFQEIKEVVEDNIVVKGVHKTVQAGLGAATMAQDETGSLFNKMVERGEKFEQKRSKQLRAELKKPKKEIDKFNDKMSDKVGGVFTRVLNWLNIPTRSDVKTLNAKVTTLTKKVNELKKVQAGA